LNVPPPSYVTRVEDFVPLPGAFEAVGRLCRAGWPVAVCTNQSCIGRGLVSAEVVDRIHDECARIAALHGARFDGFHVCPHRPEDACPCRKPRPGLLLDAARDHGYDLARSYFVGDAQRDVEAARAAGATPILVRTGGADEAGVRDPETAVFDDTAQACAWILAHAGTAT
jgi:D-glycero-D-manno-heptose 1,7-bisphosphate phosphatase